MAITMIKKKAVSGPQIKSKPKLIVPVKKPIVTAFDDVSSEIPNSGKFIMLYGEPGCGKTTLAAQFPKPFYIITHGETGIDYAKKIGVADKNIKVVRLPELYKNDEIPDGVGHEGFTICTSTLRKFSEGGHDFKTAVVDTSSGMVKINEQHCASLEFKGDMKSRGQDEWNAWANGPRRACDGYWLGEFIPACLSCVEAGYNVILIAHSKQTTIKNPNGPDYIKFIPDMDERIFNATNKVCHYCFFIGIQPEFQIEEKTKKRTVKANNYFIGVKNETWYTAKNWDNIQSPIFCGNSAAETFENLCQYFDFN